MKKWVLVPCAMDNPKTEIDKRFDDLDNGLSAVFEKRHGVVTHLSITFDNMLLDDNLSNDFMDHLSFINTPATVMKTVNEMLAR